MEKFTPTQKLEIEELFNQGYTVRQISRRFEVKAPTILSVLHKYNTCKFKSDFYNLDLLYKIRGLNNEGFFKKDIVEKLGMKQEKLDAYFYLIKRKYPSNHFDRLGFAREDVLRVIALVEKGYTNIEIGFKLGKRTETISNCISCILQCGVHLKKGQINYSKGLELPEIEDEVIEKHNIPKVEEIEKVNVSNQVKNKFMGMKKKGFTDKEVSKELNVDMKTIEQLKEECAKYKIFFNN